MGDDTMTKRKPDSEYVEDTTAAERRAAAREYARDHARRLV